MFENLALVALGIVLCIAAQWAWKKYGIQLLGKLFPKKADPAQPKV
ncbi:MAG: hypothetical protein ABSC54_00745 [Smithellaceae bacterium]|jgi:hypothetical protein